MAPLEFSAAVGALSVTGTRARDSRERHVALGSFMLLVASPGERGGGGSGGRRRRGSNLVGASLSLSPSSF